MIRQAIKEAAREAEKEQVAKRAARRPAREPRVSFEAMSSVEYSALRQLDWFSQERDEELED
jgi:hypothetical protein